MRKTIVKQQHCTICTEKAEHHGFKAFTAAQK